MTSVNCPRCGQIDAVQKVSSILASGTFTGTVDGTAPVTWQGKTHHLPVQHQTQVTTHLVSLLKPPTAPTLVRSGGGCWIVGGWISLVYGIGISMVSIGRVFNPPERMVSAPFPFSEPWFVIAVGFLLGAIAVYIGIKGLRRKNSPRIRAQRDKVERENSVKMAAYNNARTRYDQLYYCSRDDCVFIPGEAHSAPVSNMNSLLYS
jgi:hypothetical protein